jgi:ketosteroid isomerase-like protein
MGAPADTVLEAFRRGDSHDFAGLSELQTDDFELVMPGMTVKGRAQLQGFYEPTWAAFPDGKHRIDNVIEVGDTVVVEAFWRGHHTGPLGMPDGSEMAPTGREVSFHIASVNRLRGDSVERVNIYFDQGEFLRSLGVIPEMDAAPAEGGR